MEHSNFYSHFGMIRMCSIQTEMGLKFNQKKMKRKVSSKFMFVCGLFGWHIRAAQVISSCII